MTDIKINYSWESKSCMFLQWNQNYNFFIAILMGPAGNCPFI